MLSSDSFVKTSAFQSAASEILIEMVDTRAAYGEVRVDGLPLESDGDQRIVAVSSTQAKDGSVALVNVDPKDLPKYYKTAGRFVQTKVRALFSGV